MSDKKFKFKVMCTTTYGSWTIEVYSGFYSLINGDIYKIHVRDGNEKYPSGKVIELLEKVFYFPSPSTVIEENYENS